MANSAADEARQQREISEALIRVVRDRGFEGLTLRAVAAEAGCTTGLITARFPNKKALIVHTRTLMHERAVERLHRRVQGDDPRESLRGSLLASIVGEGFDGRTWLSFLAATLADEDLRAVQISTNRLLASSISQTLRRARPEWSEQEAADRASGFIITLAGLAALSTTDPDWYQLPRLNMVLENALDAALK